MRFSANAGPYMGPTLGAALQRQAEDARLQGQLVQEQSRALVRSGIASVNASHAQAMNVGASNAQTYRDIDDRKISNKLVPVAVAMVLWAWYMIPDPQARRAFRWWVVTTFAGLFLMNWDPTRNDHMTIDEMSMFQTFFGEMTIATWVLWTIAAYSFVRYVFFSLRWRMGKGALDGPVDAQPVPVLPTLVQPQPRAAQPITSPAPAPAPPSDAEQPLTPQSKIVIPSFPGQDRPVRRGGTTLSGVPIKDRRTVDPRELGTHQHD